MKVTVCREAHFNAAHRLYNPAWNEDRNNAVFGKCNNPNFHGHNYELIAKVTGPIDPDTGYVIDMKWLAELLETQIVGRFDHKNLNLDIAEFQYLIPTAENIVVVCWNLLRPHIDPALDLSCVLYETKRNSVEYHGR